jgi:hypothetical protein
MFMMMDDVGAFIWRYGKRLLTSGVEADVPAGGHPPATAVKSPDAE